MSFDPPIRVLVICYGNSARSIFAEALIRHHGGADFEAFSAGIEPIGVHPMTIRVLEEAGFDHSWARSKSVQEYIDQPFDYVITVCDDARSVCPFFPGADQSMHWGYKSPSSVTGTDAERRAAYDRVFIDLSERIRQFVMIAGRSQPATAVG